MFVDAEQVAGASAWTDFPDQVQFGRILITGLAVGLVPPPVGMCLKVASVISKLSIGKIFRRARPFLLANRITLIAITHLPVLGLWLPPLFFE